MHYYYETLTKSSIHCRQTLRQFTYFKNNSIKSKHLLIVRPFCATELTTRIESDLFSMVEKIQNKKNYITKCEVDDIHEIILSTIVYVKKSRVHFCQDIEINKRGICTAATNVFSFPNIYHSYRYIPISLSRSVGFKRRFFFPRLVSTFLTQHE